jgi:hypothetical protein
MTELKLENLVRDGVRVVVDNVTSLVRLASTEAGQRATTVVPSVKRHLLSSPAQPESDARPHYSAINGGNNAPRAGRLAVSAGVPSSRIPPTSGGRACRKVGPGLKTLLPLLSRLRSGSIGNGFGQPFQARAFSGQLPTLRHCPQWQKQQPRMPRVATGRMPVGGR